MAPSAEFVDLIQILGVATLAAVVATMLRQPIVVAFIFVGVFVGPAGISLVPSTLNLLTCSGASVSLCCSSLSA